MSVPPASKSGGATIPQVVAAYVALADEIDAGQVVLPGSDLLMIANALFTLATSVPLINDAGKIFAIDAIAVRFLLLAATTSQAKNAS